jgi:hypothetical protein
MNARCAVTAARDTLGPCTHPRASKGGSPTLWGVKTPFDIGGGG